MARSYVEMVHNQCQVHQKYFFISFLLRYWRNDEYSVEHFV